MFAYDEAVTERFPAIRAGAIHATNLTNEPSSPGLLEEYRAEQRAAYERLEATAIADPPSIAAWRRVFSGFGAKPTRHRNAAEAPLRRLAKHGDVPTVNALVDLGNLVSIRYAVPVFDLANIDGPITVRFATGDEPFTDLGSTDVVHPDPGEVVFVDGRGVVSARRWCWRQSAQSATGATTTPPTGTSNRRSPTSHRCSPHTSLGDELMYRSLEASDCIVPQEPTFIIKISSSTRLVGQLAVL